MNDYFESFINFWIPIYEKQIFKAKLMNQKEILIDIQANIWKNWNFTIEQKYFILKKLNIKKI